MIKFFLFSLLFFANFLIFAQKYSLQQAIDSAIKHNNNVVVAELELEFAKLNQKSALDFGKTNISYTLGQFNSFYLDNGIAVNQNVNYPGYYINYGKFLNATKNVAADHLQQVKIDMIAEVKKSYCSLQFLKSENIILKLQDSIFSKLVQTIFTPQLKEKVTAIEKVSAQSRLIEIKNKLDENENDMITEALALQVILKLNYPIEISETELLFNKLDQEISESDLANNPDLLRQKADVTVREKWIGVERSKLMPDFNVSYFSNTIYGTQSVNGEDVFYGTNKRFQGITLNVALPIFPKPYFIRIKEAKLAKLILENQYDFSKIQLQGSIRTKLMQYHKYQKLVNDYKLKSLPLSEEILAQTQSCYQSEIDNYLECVEAFNQAVEIKLNYLQKLKTLNHLIIELEHLTGKYKQNK